MIKEANKFAVILNARKTDTSDSERVMPGARIAILPATEAPTPKNSKSKRKRAEIPTTAIPSVAPTEVNRIGGKGKSSDPNFKQVTAYIPKDLHTNASIAARLANELRVDAEKEDFSELLTRLLADWYEKQNFYKPNT